MHRRQFLQLCTLASFQSLWPLSGWAFSNDKNNGDNQRLIVILLRGGMDGLNVVIPYGDSHYYAFRPSIAVARPGGELGAIDLNGYFGLHPACEPLMKFWQSKTLAFVHASGSPDPSRSHFDAQDYMETGVLGHRSIGSGWLNRLISQLPSKNSHLQALSFGPVLPKIFSGPENVAVVSKIGGTANANKMILDRPVVAKLFEDMYSGRNDTLGKAFAEGIAAHRAIDKALQAPSNNAADVEQIVANRGAPLPQNFSSFGKQLAHLINKDQSVQVAFLDFGGWDTHVNEGTGKGQLAGHLAPLASGLIDLVDGLGDLYKNTTIAIMSEFGRTVRENGNGGTDHGHGNVMFLMGGSVPGGTVYGRWAGLAEKDLNENRDLPTTTDFRNVIAHILNNNMEVSNAAIAQIFPDFKVNAKNVLIKT